MRNAVIFVFIACVALMLAGCVTPVQKVGCCLKSNATGPDSDGCMIYNMTDYEIYDYRSDTIGPCDREDLGNDGHCNVTFGGKMQLIPICTEDMLGSCFFPDCKAMVCGDFKFTPRVAPGFTSVEDAEGQVPPGTDDENMLNFYEAQCRFLNMDTRLRTAMKNSNSLINAFRVGIGEAFSDFDQYRYYFPISDQYCNINPALTEDDFRVDRYMNYVGPENEPFLPTVDMEEDCLVDDGDVPPPFRFGFATLADASDISGPWDIYDITDPDVSGYKFREFWRTRALEEDDYEYTPTMIRNEYKFKKIDDDFYRKSLVTAYFDDIYGGEGRAPFECDTQAYDCYSGDCDTSFYSRGMMLTGASGDPSTWTSVDGGCNLETDATGHQKVVCFPKKDAYIAPGGDVVIQYATVQATNWLFEIELDGYGVNDINEDDADPPDDLYGCCREGWPSSCGADDYSWNINHVCQLRWEWMDITGKCLYSSACRSRFGASCGDACDMGDPTTGYYKNNDMFFGNAIFSSMPNDFGYTREDPVDGSCDTPRCTLNSGDGKCYCPYYDFAPNYPPAAQVEFFGTFGENDYEKVIWNGDLVIGYSLAREPEFDDLFLYEACNLAAHPEDYVHLDLNNPAVPADYHDGADTVHNLMQAFLPYFEHRIFEMQSDVWPDGTAMLDGDIVISSIPWVIAYKRGSWSGNTFDTDIRFMTEPANYYLSRNYLDEPIPEWPYNYYGVSPAELRLSYDISHDRTYTALMSREITLLMDGDGDNMFGDCMIDERSGLPMMRTFGWCKPCTLSTLAYQYVLANDTTYIDAWENDVEAGTLTQMCTVDGISGSEVSCFHPTIIDLDIYQGELAKMGTMRTYPDASYMKERMEVYMRSGIMPVIDLKDDSNWNLENPFHPGTPYEYFDSRFLLDNKGAMIVIVDELSCFPNCPASVDTNQIMQRANSIRNSCPRCMTAVSLRVGDNESFSTLLDLVFSDPRIDLVVDMVSIDYGANWGEISDPPSQTSDDPSERAVQMVDDMASFARLSLLQAGKPSLITQFGVSEATSAANDGPWNEETFETLFNTVIINQDTLVKAGIIGVIFSPVRTPYGVELGSDAGIVDDTSGVGVKTEKFCSLERAINKMRSQPIYATFTPIVQQDSVECVACSEIEISLGLCEAPEALECDAGGECTHAPGDEGSVKCPTDAIVKISADENCQLCNATFGKYICDYAYINGTIETKEYNARDIDSLLYAEVMAGLERPDKCCVKNVDDVYFSYGKTSMPSPMNRPVVYSASGNPAQDCGVTSSASGIGETSFCGYDLPVQQYDINCSYEPPEFAVLGGGMVIGG
ncbi:MAG: hypothetical protein ABIH29_01000 [Candidatus Micrarchaeota archaeon]